jgi:coenzyme PQQ precursor peptide PqqA
MAARPGLREDSARNDVVPPADILVGGQPRRRHPMQWTTPAATDLRFGFEITMYVAAR